MSSNLKKTKSYFKKLLFYKIVGFKQNTKEFLWKNSRTKFKHEKI